MHILTHANYVLTDALRSCPVIIIWNDSKITLGNKIRQNRILEKRIFRLTALASDGRLSRKMLSHRCSHLTSKKNYTFFLTTRIAVENLEKKNRLNFFCIPIIWICRMILDHIIETTTFHMTPRCSTNFRPPKVRASLVCSSLHHARQNEDAVDDDVPSDLLKLILRPTTNVLQQLNSLATEFFQLRQSLFAYSLIIITSCSPRQCPVRQSTTEAVQSDASQFSISSRIFWWLQISLLSAKWSRN